MKMWAIGILGLVAAGCQREDEALAEAAAGKGVGSIELTPEQEQWISLVPERGNGEWASVDFGGEGEAAWEDGTLKITRGVELTGLRWDGALPEAPYEIRLEARKLLGDDFFCGLTVPVRGKDGCVTFIVGGWGGATVGISSIDGLDASENDTTSYHKFEREKWYRIRMVVRENALQAWLDDEQVVSVDTTGREIGLRPGLIDLVSPLGVATFQTDVEMRGIEWRKLD
jgi:hypothetical protein